MTTDVQDPATITAPAAAPAAPAAPEGQQQSQQQWFDGIKSADTKQWVQSLGYPEMELLAQKAYNQEKFLGADKAGRGVVWPKDENDAEGWKAIHAKLGVPEDPSKYEIPVPEGSPAEVADFMRPVFHEFKLTPQQATGISAKWNEFVTQYTQQQEQAYAAQSEQQFEKLQQEWGPAFAERVNLANSAAKAMAVAAGMQPEDAKNIGMALERAFGVDAAAKMLAQIGRNYAETGKEHGLDGAGNKSFALTKPEAEARRAQLMKDKEFADKWRNGDIKARQEMSALDKIIAGA